MFFPLQNKLFIHSKSIWCTSSNNRKVFIKKVKKKKQKKLREGCVTNLGGSPGVVLSLDGDLLASFLGDQEVLYLPGLGAILDHEYHSIAAHNIPMGRGQLCQER